MIDQDKIKLIREYLQDEFPGFEIDDTYDFDHISQTFRASNKSEVYVVKFEKIFIDDTSDLKKVLQDLKLVKIMYNNKGRQIIVTKKGVTVL